MSIFNVTVQAVVTKTYSVEAEDVDTAIVAAHEIFSVLPEDGINERYEQDVIEVEEDLETIEEVAE